MTERSYTVLVLGTLSLARYGPAQCSASLAVERSWQSLSSTAVPWDLPREVSGFSVFQTGGVKLLPVPQRSHKHSPAFLQHTSGQRCSWLGWSNLSFFLVMRRR